MKIIDLHCDTLTKLAENKGTEIRKNQFSVDIEKMKTSNYMAQFFALFVDSKQHRDVHNWALKLIETFEREKEKNKEFIRQARSYEDIIENERKGLISCFLTIEEGAVLKGSFDNLRDFYEKGVKIITLTWNYPNEIGYPNCTRKYMNNGLTSFGRDLVETMNTLGIIVDVSHLSDGGFYEVARISKKPFIASHSNARALVNNPRNLTDHMIKIIGQKGGVIGINFFANFLGVSDISRVDDMVRHIKHIYDIGGIEVISLGSDFDGISSEVEIEDCSKMNLLHSALLSGGFSEDAVDKIFYKNALRLIKESF